MAPVSVPRSWVGETVVCLASGPSLTAADVDAVRGKARVIAVNDTIRLAPWADCLYSSDRYWYRFHKGVPSFRGLKFGVGQSLGKAKPYGDLPDVQILENTGDEGLELAATGLRTGKNSGYAAINLALHFGVSRIVLLGYDMGASPFRTHFFGEHPAPLNNPQKSHFHAWLRYFDTLAWPLRQAGVDVINCSRATNLRCFSRKPLEAVLPVEVLA